ncbi:MAG: bifunctional proline dehydrogenase/L-glutamate gamma-semialdehyde dehydrogenase PutA [Janthinobacterium lividum]
MIDQMMHQYPLSSTEGLLLMSLAEALLRIPDHATRRALLQDKMSQGDFKKYLDTSASWLMNLGTRGFDLSATLLKTQLQDSFLKKTLSKVSLPLIEQVSNQAMSLLAQKFIFGQTIEKALKNAPKNHPLGYGYSFDMLGEAAITQEEADRYFQDYLNAIQQLAKASSSQSKDSKFLSKKDSISVKLSALHPRYTYVQEDRVMTELSGKILQLCQAAARANISLTIDAEESERLEMSLKLIEHIVYHPDLKGWYGLGVAVQAYQKRATQVIDNLIDLAQQSQKYLSIRLVKGAYWDSEIKKCQELGLKDYPVFTRKESTDVSYMCCAQKMLKNTDFIFPQFATHNALTVATILEWGADPSTYEFQKLHGMGDDLYETLRAHQDPAHSFHCRIYAPIGNERELLPYLVRRLLENGANSSFVNHVQDTHQNIEDLLIFADEKLATYPSTHHPKIPLPDHIYDNNRLNSLGLDLSDSHEIQKISDAIDVLSSPQVYPMIGKTLDHGIPLSIYNPAHPDQCVGVVYEASSDVALEALNIATQAFLTWSKTSAVTRAACLRQVADLMTSHMYSLMGLIVKEAGKTIPDAIGEVREAIDFCRYYAERGETDFQHPLTLTGVTGETNQLSWEGRGVFVCISPWNFPLAIFVGQVAAALMAGNCVIAKPARQTPLIAHQVCQLFYQAGVPKEVLHYLPGSGSDMIASLLKDDRVSGVAFTGSTTTAWSINRTLAARECAIAPLIAETGGQNAMIVDSSALPEQVVGDVMASAFQSAGQRCSALRILCVQSDIAPRIIDLLKGAMAELTVGDPAKLSTDVGPVIDAAAQKSLAKHCEMMKTQAKLIYQCHTPDHFKGHFLAPVAFELTTLDILTEEVFGPVLHVIRFQESDLENLIERLNQLKFGLTFGLQTRLDGRIKQVVQQIQSGNVYVNRNMIGAVVGIQPFGGRGLSGTGPKAGGPHYLHRFAHEKTISINTTAQGGNTSLMMF